MVLYSWAFFGSDDIFGVISPALEIAVASEIERIPADPLADCPGDGWRRQLTEQQHDVPSATWPGREGRPDQGLGFGWGRRQRDQRDPCYSGPARCPQTRRAGGHDRLHGLQNSASATGRLQR